MTLVALEIPSKSAYVGVARLATSVLGRAAGLDEGAIDDLKIAVSEACTNAVLRNEEAGTVAPVTVTWHDEGDHIRVEIGDTGSPFDPEDLYREDEPAARLRLSLALLQGLVDDCSIASQEAGGLCTTLVLRR